MTIFIDVSYYDPILVWKDYEWDGAFIKCTEGIVPDKKFKEQWAAARGWTIRGPYHYFHPAIDPKATAQKFLAHLGTDLGELPPALDMETTNGVSPKQVAEAGLTWLHIIQRDTGKAPIVYTSPNFISVARLYDYQEYRNFPLWLAAYPRDKITPTWTEQMRKDWIYTTLQQKILPVPTQHAPFPYVDWYQWTGKCPPDYVPGYPLGVKDAVDIEFCTYTKEQLYAKFKIVLPPTGDDMEDQTITMEADLKPNQPSNLRPNYGLNGGLTRTLVGPLHVKCMGSKIPADGYYWSKVVYIDDVPTNGWIAWTTAYTNIVIHNPTPPTGRKIVKSTLFFDDNTTEDLYPQQ